MLETHETVCMMQNMKTDVLNQRTLEAFSAVVETGSITGAARRLGRSQSAVTRLVQDLEVALEFPLLHRSGPRVTPTEQGVLFYGEAEQLLTSLRHTEACARAIATSTLRPLEIAAPPALSVGLVPRALARVDAALLPTDVYVNTLPAERVVGEVVARTAEYGVSSYPFGGAGIDVHWVGEAPCVAVVRADHPLSSQTVVAIEDLAGQRLLTLSTRLRQRIDDTISAAGVRPAGVFQSGASSTVLAMAREGLGVAIIDPATAYGLPLDGLIVRHLDQNIPFVIGGFSRTGRPLSPSATAVSEAILAQAFSVLPGFRLRPANSNAHVSV